MYTHFGALLIDSVSRAMTGFGREIQRRRDERPFGTETRNYSRYAAKYIKDTQHLLPQSNPHLMNNTWRSIFIKALRELGDERQVRPERSPCRLLG